MCGITGFINTPGAGTKVVKALNVMEARGRQAAGIWAASQTQLASTPAELPQLKTNTAMGHLLHAMVDCVPQPLQGSGVLVANCEIYNWKELSSSLGIQARNDSELLLGLLDQMHPDITGALELLDGVYSFAYLRQDTVTLARDLIGEKPLFYSTEDGFAFASERKALVAQGYKHERELYPRTVLSYNTNTKVLGESKRPFFTINPLHEASEENIRNEVKRLLESATNKRVPEHNARFGLLLSGGLDSSVLAVLLRNHKPLVYVVGGADSPDVLAAKELAELLELPLKIISPTDTEISEALPAVIATIEDSNPIKVAVGITMWFGCRAAAADGCRAVFAGGGAEDLFAGYERHRRSTDLNKECLSGLRKMHERDLYRDDTISMRFAVELRLPFLDIELVRYSLRIPAQYKYDEGVDKRVLRHAALELGLPERFALRAKKAAQYGSGVMKQLERLGKQRGQLLASYLSELHGKPNKRLAALLSTGKDSVLALHIMARMAYDIRCAVTIESENPHSYMFHTPNVHLARLQADSMRLPLITASTAGEQEEELTALTEALRQAIAEHGIEGVVAGALASQYQRERIETVCDALGLTVFSPLWQMDQLDELKLLLHERFEVIFTHVAAEGLDHTWLGERLDRERIDRLAELQRRYGLHPAGEGGEYESLVLDAPLFRERIVLGETQIIKDGSSSTLLIKEASTANK
jgi:diphthine-ammonia ligase